MVCLTGAAAVEAIARGEAFEKRLEAAFELPYIEMDAESRRIAAELSSLVCSAYLKTGLFDQRLKALVKKVVKLRAANAKAAVQALEKELAAGAEGKESATRTVIRRIDGIGGKQAKKLLSAMVKKLPGVAVAVFDVDEAKGKVAMYAAVGANSSIEANAWCTAAIAAANGRGGGKKNYAQATGAAEFTDAAMQAAEKFTA